MAEITRQDIAADDVLKFPLELSENFQTLIGTLDQVIAKTKQFGDSGKDPGLPKLKTDTEGLTQAQIELVKVQNQISTALAKDNDAYREQQKVLADLKQSNKEKLALGEQESKQITAQNASIVQLNTALNANRVAYSNLRGETERSGKAGQDLLKTIQQQDKDFKALSTSMGQNQPRVGGYREEIEKLMPALQKVAPAAAEASEAVAGLDKKLLAIATSPIGLVLMAIAIAFQTLWSASEAYFEHTVEGSDKATEHANQYSAVMSVLKSKWKELGQATSDWFALDSGGLASQLMFQFMGAIGQQGKYIEKLIIANQLSAIQNKLKKEEITIVTELAEKQLEKDKELFDSRDKIRKSEEDRFQALLKQREVEQDIVALKLKENAAQQTEVKERMRLSGTKFADNATAKDILDSNQLKKDYELIKELADLEAEASTIVGESLLGQRRQQAQLGTLVQEGIKIKIDADKQIIESANTVAETLYTKQVDTNARIVGNQRYSIDEQLAAEKQLIDGKQALNDLGFTKEIQSLHEATFNRIKLTSEESDQIYEMAAGNYELLIALTVAAKNKKIETDEIYLEHNRVISEKQFEQDQRLAREGGDAVAAIIANNYKHFIELRKKFIQEDSDAELLGLDQQFAAGEVSVAQYEAKKLKIQRKAAEESAAVEKQEDKAAIADIIKLLQTKTNLTQSEQDLLLKLQKDFHKAEIDEQHAHDAAKIQAQLDFNARQTQARQQLFSDARAINDNFATAQEQSAANQIKTLETQKDKEIAMAGDNKAAIAQINKKFADEELILNKKVAEEKRRAAIFDKLLALAQIAINTEKAASADLAKYQEFAGPYIALDIALGAAQAAVVLSKPIPTYQVGTKNHPGGPAIVGEAGPELINIPGQGISLTPNAPTLMDLPAGTEVLPNAATMKMLALSGLLTSSDINRSGHGKSQESQLTDKLLRELNTTIKNKKELHIHATPQGLEAMIRNAESRVKFLGEFYA